MSSAAAELPWQWATDLLARPGVTRSTMMGYPCLRFEGRFFACTERGTGDLVVKLPAPRVLELIREGIGAPFAPNGRVFKEWIVIPSALEARWTALIDEALELASAS